MAGPTRLITLAQPHFWAGTRILPGSRAPKRFLILSTTRDEPNSHTFINLHLPTSSLHAQHLYYTNITLLSPTGKIPHDKHRKDIIPPAPEMGLNIRPPTLPEDDDDHLDLAVLGPIKTTKQVKAEYCQRTRISKEELRRVDEERREEERQDRERERKEAEKAKAAKRARFLRDKKKAKEEEQRAEKRRQGLPTVAVHPSQATISWLARGAATKASTKRTVDQIEDAEGGENPPKRTQVSHPAAQPSMDLPPPAPSPLRDHADVPSLEPPVQPPSPPTAVRVKHVPKLSGGDHQSLQSLQRLAGKDVSAKSLQRLSQLADGLDDMLQRERGRQAQRKATKKPTQKPNPKPVTKPVTKKVTTVNQLGNPKPVSTANQLAQQVGSFASRPVAAATKMVNKIKNAFPYFSTQDLVMSTQDIQEVESPVAAKSKSPAAKMFDRIKNSIPFFSSQDLVMSTQDIWEVEGTTDKSNTKPPSSSKPRPSQSHDGQLVPPQKGPVGTSLDESYFGDDVFDDYEAIELLEKIESGSTTPRVIEPAAVPNAPEVAAGNSGNIGAPTESAKAPVGGTVLVEDLLGDGDWLSDDDKLGV